MDKYVTEMPLCNSCEHQPKMSTLKNNGKVYIFLN